MSRAWCAPAPPASAGPASGSPPHVQKGEATRVLPIRFDRAPLAAFTGRYLGLDLLPLDTVCPVGVTGFFKDGTAFWAADVLVIK